jgi:hypothetical protein
LRVKRQTLRQTLRQTRHWKPFFIEVLDAYAWTGAKNSEIESVHHRTFSDCIVRRSI